MSASSGVPLLIDLSTPKHPITRPMITRPFVKMHGLGNDAVIFDARAEPLLLSAEAALF